MFNVLCGAAKEYFSQDPNVENVKDVKEDESPSNMPRACKDRSFVMGVDDNPIDKKEFERRLEEEALASGREAYRQRKKELRAARTAELGSMKARGTFAEEDVEDELERRQMKEEKMQMRAELSAADAQREAALEAKEEATGRAAEANKKAAAAMEEKKAADAKVMMMDRQRKDAMEGQDKADARAALANERAAIAEERAKARELAREEAEMAKARATAAQAAAKVSVVSSVGLKQESTEVQSARPSVQSARPSAKEAASVQSSARPSVPASSQRSRSQSVPASNRSRSKSVPASSRAQSREPSRVEQSRAGLSSQQRPSMPVCETMMEPRTSMKKTVMSAGLTSEAGPTEAEVSSKMPSTAKFQVTETDSRHNEPAARVSSRIQRPELSMSRPEQSQMKNQYVTSASDGYYNSVWPPRHSTLALDLTPKVEIKDEEKSRQEEEAEKADAEARRAEQLRQEEELKQWKAEQEEDRLRREAAVGEVPPSRIGSIHADQELGSAQIPERDVSQVSSVPSRTPSATPERPQKQYDFEYRENVAHAPEPVRNASEVQEYTPRHKAAQMHLHQRQSVKDIESVTGSQNQARESVHEATTAVARMTKRHFSQSSKKKKQNLVKAQGILSKMDAERYGEMAEIFQIVKRLDHGLVQFAAPLMEEHDGNMPSAGSLRRLKDQIMEEMNPNKLRELADVAPQNKVLPLLHAMTE